VSALAAFTEDGAARIAHNRGVKVDCNECGASLIVGAATRFATCVKCKSRLEIKRGDGSVYSEKLADAKAEEAASQSDPGSGRASLGGGGDGETFLRIVIGLLLIGSDIFWFIRDPSMQSLPVRIALLAAGAWLLISGLYRLIKSRAA
jgi:hypothetical protein